LRQAKTIKTLHFIEDGTYPVRLDYQLLPVIEPLFNKMRIKFEENFELDNINIPDNYT
jgi:hypothetical protein